MATKLKKGKNMYKYGICAALLIVIPSHAMEQEQAASDDNELSSSVVVVSQPCPYDFLASNKFQGTDEEFFDYFNNGPLNYALNYSSTNPAAKTFVQSYFTDSAQRGNKLLEDLRIIKAGIQLDIQHLQKDVDIAHQMRATWQESYRREKASNVKLQNTVVALGATSLSLAGLAAYLYMKKN